QWLLGVGMAFVPLHQAGRLIQSALADSEIAQAHDRVRPHVAGDRVEGPERVDQLELRPGPVAGRSEYAGIGGATGAGHTDLVVGVKEWLRDLSPLLGALEVHRSLAA